MSTAFFTMLSNTRNLMAAVALVSAGLAFLVVGETPVQAQNGASLAVATPAVTAAPLPDLSPVCDKRIRVVYHGYGEAQQENCLIR